jgi:hypothetical protein
MPAHESPPSRPAVFGAALFAVEDPLADRVEQLTLQADIQRKAAADLLQLVAVVRESLRTVDGPCANGPDG